MVVVVVVEREKRRRGRDDQIRARRLILATLTKVWKVWESVERHGKVWSKKKHKDNADLSYWGLPSYRSTKTIPSRIPFNSSIELVSV